MDILCIDPELQSLIPPLTDEEYRQLEANVISDGCRDALIIWKGIIVDGHNRYRICTEHKIPFKTVEKDFSDRSAVLEWIIRNQFGRRNLSPGNRSLLALRLEDVFKEKARINKEVAMQKARALNPNNAQEQFQQNTAETVPVETREELAKIAGVSHDTIGKVKRIVEKGTPEQVERIKKGDKGNSVRAVYNEIVQKEKPAAAFKIPSEPEQESPETQDQQQEQEVEPEPSVQPTSLPAAENSSDDELPDFYMPDAYDLDKVHIEMSSREDKAQTKKIIRDLKDINDNRSYTPRILLAEYYAMIPEFKNKMDWYRQEVFDKIYAGMNHAEAKKLHEINGEFIRIFQDIDEYQVEKTQKKETKGNEK